MRVKMFLVRYMSAAPSKRSDFCDIEAPPLVHVLNDIMRWRDQSYGRSGLLGSN